MPSAIPTKYFTIERRDKREVQLACLAALLQIPLVALRGVKLERIISDDSLFVMEVPSQLLSHMQRLRDSKEYMVHGPLVNPPISDASGRKGERRFAKLSPSKRLRDRRRGKRFHL